MADTSPTTTDRTPAKIRALPDALQASGASSACGTGRIPATGVRKLLDELRAVFAATEAQLISQCTHRSADGKPFVYTEGCPYGCCKGCGVNLLDDRGGWKKGW
jgi:hypothetical protein